MTTDVQTTTPESPPTEQLDSASRLRRSLSLLGSLQGYIGLVLIVLVGVITKGQIFWNQQNLTQAIG